MSYSNKTESQKELFLGEARILFANGARTSAIAAVQGYRELGNTVSVTLQSEKTEVPHYGSYAGRLRLDKTEVVKSSDKFILKLDELTTDKIALFLLGDSSSVITSSTLANTVLRGMCRIILENTQNLPDELPEFHCELRVNGNSDADGINFTNLEFILS